MDKVTVWHLIGGGAFFASINFIIMMSAITNEKKYQKITGMIMFIFWTVIALGATILHLARIEYRMDYASMALGLGFGANLILWRLGRGRS